jgi:hypothetical protein
MENVNIKLRILDEATQTIKKVEKTVISSTKNMSKEESKYAKEIAKTQTKIFELKQEMVSASKQRKKDIQEEIRALNTLQQANKAAYSQTKKNSPSGKFAEVIDQSPLSGMVGLMSNPYAAAGAGIAAVGTAIYNTTEKVIASQDIWRQRVQGTEDDYKRLGEQTLKIGNVFGKTNEEIAKSGNSFAKSFGIDAKEGLDMVYEGFKKGADMNGEFLSNLNEYSVQAKANNMTAEEFVGFLIAAEKQGIYNDKGIDVIKEGGIRLRENTKAAKAALGYLDKTVQAQIKSKVAAGKPVASKSAYSTAAQKRMKADAEGTYKAVSTKTRVLPEIKTGKIQTVKKRK